MLQNDAVDQIKSCKAGSQATEKQNVFKAETTSNLLTRSEDACGIRQMATVKTSNQSI